MSPRHFSSKGGPYFITDLSSQHQNCIGCKVHNGVSLIGKIRSLFKFPRSKPAK